MRSGRPAVWSECRWVTKRRVLLHADAGFGGAADHAGAAIDDVHAVAGDDGGGGSHAVRFGIGSAGAEQDHAGILSQGDGAKEERPASHG